MALRGRWFGGGVILGYHRVAEEPSDPQGLAVSPNCFREHMAILRENHLPMPLGELVASAHGQALSQERVPVAVTFDDGYRDVVLEALPILEEFQVPATVFVVTGSDGWPFWWDSLDRIASPALVLPGSLDLSTPSGPIRWTRQEGIPSLLRRLLLGLRQAPESVREELLREVWGWAGIDPARQSPTQARVLTDEEIRSLDPHPLLEIGSHSRSHRPLPGLPEEVLTDEITGSRERLDSLLGRPVEGFSYPFGLEDEGVREKVREAGYLYACSSRPGLVTGQTDAHHLPRLWPPALGGEGFREWFRSWTGR
jgi:peptidoglycan/xylan/chitin deacetylase (PgdA/CDA1 family)